MEKWIFSLFVLLFCTKEVVAADSLFAFEGNKASQPVSQFPVQNLQFSSTLYGGSQGAIIAMNMNNYIQSTLIPRTNPAYYPLSVRMYQQSGKLLVSGVRTTNDTNPEGGFCNLYTTLPFGQNFARPNVTIVESMSFNFTDRVLDTIMAISSNQTDEISTYFFGLEQGVSYTTDLTSYPTVIPATINSVECSNLLYDGTSYLYFIQEYTFVRVSAALQYNGATDSFEWIFGSNIEVLNPTAEFNGVTSDNSGNIYLLSSMQGAVYKYTSKTNSFVAIVHGLAVAEQLTYSSGNLYITGNFGNTTFLQYTLGSSNSLVGINIFPIIDGVFSMVPNSGKCVYGIGFVMAIFLLNFFV